jgi:predicted DCC family thiol-disulfide oxidoreductase YuxK
MNKQYIIFDGDCAFCNQIVMLLAKNDTQNKFIFISNTSDKFLELEIPCCAKEMSVDAIILLEGKSIFVRGKAIKNILVQIPKFKILGYLLLPIPNFIVDVLYRLFAKIRRKINVKRECIIDEALKLKIFL